MLTLTDVVKRYGGVVALDGAHFSATPGEVHGLLGPNGSGKSTINKVLAGSVCPDAGTITIAGNPVIINSPKDAHRHGIEAAYQQLSLVTSLTVGHNLVLGTESAWGGFLCSDSDDARANAMLEKLRPGLGNVTLTTPTSALDPGQAQLIEIGKVLLRSPRILILDEATASLRQGQVELLFELIAAERARGTCVIFVSHRLNEIMAVCDRATILRAGRTVATTAIADSTPAELVRLMVGETLSKQERAASVARPQVLLEVRGLTTTQVRQVDLHVNAGEIVGLGGLQGQGQSELLLGLFGAIQHQGGITLRGHRLPSLRTHRAARLGFALVPGNRNTQGMASQRPIQENLSITSLWRRALALIGISVNRERLAAQSGITQLAIKVGDLTDPISSLSGGNAQKVIVAKWLLNNPDVILLDDPTKGVDVGAKAEIYQIIRTLAAAGKGIIINSSEDRELVTLCDRILVMYEGKVVSELCGEQITSEALMTSSLQVED